MRMPPRRRRPILVPTASMGDIAFLLTIFFILTSNFARESGLRLTPPRAPEVSPVKEPHLSVVIDENGQIYLQGGRVANSDALESALTVLLRTRPTPDARQVMLKCDRSVDRSVFEPVLGAIARAGGVIVAVGDRPRAE